MSGKDVRPTDTHREVEKKLFEYTPLGAKLDQQGKTFEKQGKDIVEAIKDDKNIKALTAIAVSPEILKSLSALPEPPKGLKNLFTVRNIKTVLRNQFKKIKDNEEDKYLFELDKKMETSRKDRPGKLEYSMKSPEIFFNNLEDDPENANDTLKNRIDKINSIQKLAGVKMLEKKIQIR